MNFFNKSLITVLISSISFSSFAGLSVGATRVIFHGNEKETSLNVINSEDSNVYLIRSWVSGDNEKVKLPFVITPPLFRIEPGQTNALRIALISNSLPQDKESIFWVNTLAIPPATNKANSLQFSINTKIKLLYRPSAIDNAMKSKAAFKELTFARQGNDVIINNPTPYYISFSAIKINGTQVQGTYTAPPKNTLKISNAPAGNKVSWKVINDYGGISEELTHSI